MTKISFIGDIALGEHYFSLGHGPRSYARKNFLFKNVKQYFEDSEYVVANLECPISDLHYDKSDPESSAFRGSPAVISQLKNAGINIVSVANNHMMQHGEEVFKDTIKNLEKNGIKVIGKSSQEPLLLDANNKISILACSDIEDNTYKDQTSYQRWNEGFKKTINTYVNQGVVVIIFIHWGREDKHKPTDRQIEIEKDLKKLGVRIIVGHHPHIFYPVKYHNNFICAYSIGDFVFDLPWDKKLLKTGILNISIDKTLSAEIVPVYIKKQGCLPTATGKIKNLSFGEIDMYRYRGPVSNIQLKKLFYFSLNYFRGKTALKTKFLLRKIKGKMSGL